MTSPLSRTIQWLNTSCSSVVFSATILSVCIFYYDPFFPSLFVFAVLNSLLGKALKLIIGVQRPLQSTKHSHSQGMPSSHANALSFHSMYLTLAIYYQDYDVGQTALFLSQYNVTTLDLSCVCVGFMLYSYTLTICYARIHYTHDHTIEQILVGLVMGTTNACLNIHSIHLLATEIPDSPRYHKSKEYTTPSHTALSASVQLVHLLSSRLEKYAFVRGLPLRRL